MACVGLSLVLSLAGSSLLATSHPDDERASIHGELREDVGSPVVVEFIHLTNDDHSVDRRMATDDQGSFVFDDLPPGRYHLDLALRDHLPPHAFHETRRDRWSHVELKEGERREVTYVCPRKRVRDVQVCFRDGTPATFTNGGRLLPAQVLISVRSGPGLRYHAHTDAGGVFALPGLPPGELDVTIRAGNYIRSLRYPAITVIPERLALPPGGELEVVVETPLGAPAPSAVKLEGMGTFYKNTLRVDGGFVVDDLPPGIHRVRVLANGFEKSVAHPVVLRPGERTVTKFWLEPSRPPSVSLRVIDEQEMPIAGAIVAMGGRTKETDSGGCVTLSGDLYSSHYGVRKKGYRTLRGWGQEFVPGETSVVVLLPADSRTADRGEVVEEEPDSPAIEVRGRVFLDGEPVCRGMVIAWSDERTPFARTVTGPFGDFDLVLARPGDWLITCDPDWVAANDPPPSRRFRTVMPIRRSREVELNLVGHDVLGTVKDANGTAVPAARVELLDLQHRGHLYSHIILTAYTDAQGGYRFERVGPGAYELRVECRPGTYFAPRQIEVTDRDLDLEWTSPPVYPVELDLPGQATGISPTVWCRGSLVVDRSREATPVVHLPAGRHALCVYQGGHAGVAEVRVAPGVRRAEVRLRPGSLIHVQLPQRFRRRADCPIEILRLVAAEGAPARQQGITDARGRWTGCLPFGRFRIRATAAGETLVDEVRNSWYGPRSIVHVDFGDYRHPSQRF